jgi:MoaA/NifB/PqqE/SkfB family radical SAM enzyme
MCGIWKEKIPPNTELTLEELDRTLSDKLFSDLEYVGISGGEPFLRRDLPEVVELFNKHCPKLKRISITTNSLLPGRMAKTLDKLVVYAKTNDLLLNVSVSCHGLDETLDSIYGVDRSFSKMQRAFDLLDTYRSKGALSFSINTVLLRDNLSTADKLAAWADDRKIPISFVLGEQRDRFYNQEQEAVFIGIDQKDHLLDFLGNRSGNLSLSNLSPLRYREIMRIITGTGERTLPCYYALGGVLLGHEGTLYYCSHSEALGNCLENSAHDIYFDPKNLRYRQSSLLGSECKTCPPYTLTRWELQTNIFNVLRIVGIEKTKKLLASLRGNDTAKPAIQATNQVKEKRK